ncbi:MAG TPA: 50S ribosomal protein L24 [Cyclobacteriaceae bacterium]|nr:50S ribosomal protein L24 [Cyclobacteriaceae bacterium]
MQVKLHIKRGDTVKVITGNDKGKTGKVLEILADKNRAVVEGVNMITKHQKPSAGNPEGGIKKTEGSIHISNLMLVDPATGQTTRIGKKMNEKGKLQRYSKKTGELIK